MISIRLSSSSSSSFFFPSNFKFKPHFKRRSFFFSSPVFSPMDASGWACSRCTFLNSPSQNPSSCKVCLSPFPSSIPSSSSSIADVITNWACKVCTFANKPTSLSCEMCETRKESKPMSNFSAFIDLGLDQDELTDPSVGKVFLPLQRCTGRKRELPSPEKQAGSDLGKKKSLFLKPCSSNDSNVLDSGETEDKSLIKNKITLMSYNVWFREDLELVKRMQAIGDLILLHKPDLICFQEVTPNIYTLFQNSSWWKDYQCSVSRQLALERPYFCMLMSKLQVKSFKTTPFPNSIMGRELITAQIISPNSKTLILATTHLESPCPAPPSWNQMYSKERIEQAKLSLNLLERETETPSNNNNIIFAGDMNWDDKSDGPFPLNNKNNGNNGNDEWFDVWAKRRNNEEGFSYDTKMNEMLSGNRSLRKRLDRVLCRSADFDAVEIEMIGKERIEGLSYFKEKKVRGEVKRIELPVLPSDHFGLLVKFVTK
ncbi:hypothetical protein LUZ60_005420 [Juncus effusus]|nr:hypothetical protein LUZ60_005420 [Juncus effusus]